MLRRRLIGQWLAALAAFMALVVTVSGSRPALAQKPTYSANHIGPDVYNDPGNASGLKYLHRGSAFDQILYGNVTVTFTSQSQLAYGIKSVAPELPVNADGSVTLTGLLNLEASSETLRAWWVFDFGANVAQYQVQVGYPFAGQVVSGSGTFPTNATIQFASAPFTVGGGHKSYKGFASFTVTTSQP